MCPLTMAAAARSQDSVMAMLEAFVHDPLINWRLLSANETTNDMLAIHPPDNAAAAPASGGSPPPPAPTHPPSSAGAPVQAHRHTGAGFALH